MSKQDWEDGYEMGYKIGLKEGTDQSWHKWNLKEGYVKELTDEEIDSIWAEMSEQCDEEFIDMKQFARAILKKASEK